MKKVIKCLLSYKIQKGEGCIYSNNTFCELKCIRDKKLLKVGMSLDLYNITNKQYRRILQLTNSGFDIHVNLTYKSLNTNKAGKLYNH